MSAPTRVLLAAILLVVATLLIFSAVAYSDLPARIPTHFNAAGTPDAFGPRASWWLLPIIGVVSTASIIGTTLMLPRRPDLLNLPAKREILALHREAQIAVVRQAQPGLLLCGLMAASVFLLLQYATWEVAHGRAGVGVGSLVVIVPIVALATIPAIMLPVSRELRRQQAMLTALR